MSDGQIKRAAKWRDSTLNRRIRQQAEASKAGAGGLATYLGVSVEAVRQWGAGYSRPDVDKLAAIADYFGLTVDYLVGRVDVPTADVRLAEAVKLCGFTPEDIEYITDHARNVGSAVIRLAEAAKGWRGEE